MTLEQQINQEFSRQLGIESDWVTFVRKRISIQARSMQSALQDDMLATVLGDLLVAIPTNLAPHLEKAKQASHDDESLLRNIQGVIMQATRFRVITVRREFERMYRMPQVGQLQTEATFLEPTAPDEMEFNFDQAETSLKLELARMGKSKAAKIVHARLQGANINELAAQFQTPKTTMNNMLNDIKQAWRNIELRRNSTKTLA